ncbi:MAG: hypothetical protein J6O90_05895 [Candidatus Methanomethylophilaceae archaeon]|nr:hypothetical protein [Candidatus Methanomethylophilaceae archaeon]
MKWYVIGILGWIVIGSLLIYLYWEQGFMPIPHIAGTIALLTCTCGLYMERDKKRKQS